MRRESLLNSLALVKDDRAIVTTILDPTFTPEKDTAFHLFTKENPDEAYIMKINDTENLQASTFNAERPTKIIIHGWTDSVNSYWVKDMRKNYLSAGDYNVICVDWYSGAIKEYFVSARLTRQVCRHISYIENYRDHFFNATNFFKRLFVFWTKVCITVIADSIADRSVILFFSVSLLEIEIESLP